MKKLLFTLTIITALDAHATCYDLYNEKNELIYHGTVPPFSIALPNKSPEYTRSQLRGEHLVISSCFALPRKTDNPFSFSVSRGDNSCSGGGTNSSICKSCSDCKTCEAAKASLAAGNFGLDNDSDGIPCENLCGQ